MVPTVLLLCFLFLWQLFRGLDPGADVWALLFSTRAEVHRGRSDWYRSADRSSEVLGGREGAISLLDGSNGFQGLTNMLLVSPQRH